MNTKSRARILATPIASLLACLAVQRSAEAQTTYVWTVAGGGGWGTAANWNPAGPAGGAGNIADFTTVDIAAAAAITLDANRTIGAVRFADAGTANFDWTINAGSTLTLDPTAGRGIIDVVNRQATIVPVIAGNEGFQKDGAGTLRLNGANTWTGDIAINNGVLQLGNNAAISTLSDTINVNFNTGVSGGNGTTLFILDNITLGANKTVNLITGNTGGTQHRATLQGQNNAVFNGNLVYSGTSSAGINSAAGIFRINGNISGSAGTFFARGAGTGIVNGNLNLGNILFKTDPGTWIINRDGHSWVGSTTIADGQLQLGTNDAFVTTLPLVLGQGSGTSGRLEMNGFNQTVTALRTDAGSSGVAHIMRNSNLTQASTLNFTTASATTDVLKNVHIAGAPQVTGALHLVKNGDGRLEIHGGRIDNASIAVNAGTLAFTSEANRLVRAEISGLQAATIEKTGVGTLDMAANYTHAGTTRIVQGRMNFSSGNAAGIGLATGGNLGAGFRGGRLTTGGLLFEAGATTFFTGILGGAATPLVTTGNLIANGDVAVNVESASIAPGTYKLIGYGANGGLPILNAFALGVPGSSPHMSATLQDSGSSIDLVVTAVDSLVWRGNLSGTWDPYTTLSWQANFVLASDGATPANFFQSDSVLFDDTGANTVITGTGQIVMGNVMFSNSGGLDYTVSAALSGPGGVTKTGLGAVTFGNQVSVTDVTAGGGFITYTTANPHHFLTGQVITVTGSNIAGFNGHLPITVTGSNTFTVQSATTGANTNAVLASAPVNFTGPISMVDGTLTLTSANPSHGTVTVAGGTLRLGNPDAISSGALVTVSNGGTLDVNSQVPNLRVPELRISGAGVGGVGAVVNNGTGALTNVSSFSKIVMEGDVSWGGNARNDIPTATTLVGNGFTFTKVGGGETWFQATIASQPGAIVVNGGTFGVQASFPLAANVPVTVNTGAFHSLFSAITVNHPVFLNDGATLRTTNGTPTVAGTVTLNGATSFRNIQAINNTTLTVDGKITGSGGFTLADAGAVVFRNPGNDYLGDTVINGITGTNTTGTLSFGPAGSLPATTNLIVNSGNFDPSNLTHTVASISGTGGTIGQAAIGTAVLVTTQNQSTTFSGALNRTHVRMNGQGELILAGTTDNSTGTVEVNGGLVVFAKTGDYAAHSIGAAGVGLTVNSGGSVRLDGSLSATTNGTGSNIPPADIVIAAPPANYVDQIFNLTDVVLNGGVLDLNGRMEAVDGISGDGVITNTSPTPARLYAGYGNTPGSFGGVIDNGASTTELTKIGTGILTLLGASNFTGATIIAAGTLQVDGALGNTAVAVNSGSTLQGGGTIAGVVTGAVGSTINVGTNTSGASAATMTVGGLNLPSGGARTLNFDFTGTVADKIAVTGANGLVLDGTNNVNILLGSGGWTTGTYPLLTYVGSIGGTGLPSLLLQNPVGHNTVTLVDNLAGSINLQVTASTLTWLGTGGTAWDINTTNNWNSTDNKFLNGDAVVFNDTATNFAPNIASAVNAGSVTFDTAGTYALTGAAGITGMGSLTKRGTGTVTVSNANTYTGKTFAENGSLILDYSSAVPVAPASVIDVGVSATVTLRHSGGTFALANSIEGEGLVIVDPSTTTVGNRDLTMTGNLSGFTGTLRLAPTVGTMRIQVDSANDLGGATLEVKNGGQVFYNAANVIVPNDFTIEGAGWSETAGSLGAIRAANPTTFTGDITVAGSAKLGAFSGVANVRGNLVGGAFTFGGNNNANINETMQLTGSAAGLTSIAVNGGSTAGAGTITLEVGNGTQSGNLGNVPVSLRTDSKGAVLRLRQGNDYVLDTPITSTGNTNLQLDTVAGTTTGKGLSLVRSVNLNNGNLQVGTAAIPNGATAKATIELAPGETITTGSFFVGEQAQKQGLVDHLSGDMALSGRLQIGHWPNETATYNLSGGSVNLTAAAPATFPYTVGAAEQTGGVYVGVDGMGMMTQSGGTLTTNFIVLDNRGNSGVGLNMATGVDTYTLSGGTLVLKGQGIISRNASTAVNLNGGTIVANASTALDSDQITVGGLVTVNTNGNVVNNFGTLRGTGALAVGGGGTFRMGDSVDLSGGSLGSVTVQIEAGTTLLSDRVSSAIWTAGIDGAGTLTKVNAGMLTIAGNSPGFTGPTQINGGVLVVEGSLAGSAVAVNAGGRLEGNGVIGALSLNTGGTLAIGASPGQLDAGATTFNGGTFAVELNSTVVETGYDQLRVTGSVTFGANTELTLALGFTPVMGESFTIVDNDLADAVNLAGGLFTFSGTPLADDAEFGNAFFTGETRFRIDYDGGLAGGGNDIVLTVIPEPGSAVLILCGINSLMGLRRVRRRA